MSYPDEDYFVPLEDQRVFGAGIQKKGVSFVRSSELELKTGVTGDNDSSTTNTASAGGSIAEKYLSIVLPKDNNDDLPQNQPQQQQQQHSNNEQIRLEQEKQRGQDEQVRPATSSSPTSTHQAQIRRCEVCNLPIDSDLASHETSIAHQVCLTHSHPPSHIDRSRHGFRYLSAFGWDPDSRLGLGAPGREGIREPVKAKVKHDTVGLGVNVDEDIDGNSTRKKTRNQETVKPGKVEKINAKQARKGHVEAKEKNERLRKAFYQSDDVQRYLGELP